jgi:hypothetical protein
MAFPGLRPPQQTPSMGYFRASIREAIQRLHDESEKSNRLCQQNMFIRLPSGFIFCGAWPAACRGPLSGSLMKTLIYPSSLE